MPRRGTKPGFKIGRNGLRYWVASQVIRDPMGFPDRCIPLPADADEENLVELCRENTARLKAWIIGQTPQASSDAQAVTATKTRYDGTVRSASRIYQEHELSDFHTVKYNTRSTYTTSLKLIETTVGQRLLRNVTIVDVKHWYAQWRKPAVEGGKQRLKRAHEAVSMFRTVVRFLGALRVPECKLLAEELKLVRFEKSGAREVELNSGHVCAFIRTALELGNKGVIPRDRALYMAIGVAAQFETMLRQKDIIGEWPKDATDTEKAISRGGAHVRHGGEVWIGWFTWEKVPGWLWRVRTSKSKYRSAMTHDLSTYGLLFPLLEMVPHDQRVGAIVKGEHGLPMRQSSYGKWFRDIARPAGIPDEVWNMDARAGAATEAEESGVELAAISDAAGHTKQTTTLRYIRQRSKKIATVTEARAPPGARRRRKS
jgi:hypothetical protein